MEQTTLLLIIDPHNDFVDPSGSLYIPGAEKGIENIVKLIRERSDLFTDIAVTMDTHHKYHIAHPAFWNPRPEPFTQISVEDLETKYAPVQDEYLEYCRTYLKSLPGPLTIWPEHCLFGSKGWALPDNLISALHDWEIEKNNGNPFMVYKKGQNPMFEAFSLFTPEPEHHFRPYANFVEFCSFDKIIVCGFAKDICVARTVQDMLSGGEAWYRDKLVFFMDGMASIDQNAETNKVFDDAIEHFGAQILNIGD